MTKKPAPIVEVRDTHAVSIQAVFTGRLGISFIESAVLLYWEGSPFMPFESIEHLVLYLEDTARNVRKHAKVQP